MTSPNPQHSTLEQEVSKHLQSALTQLDKIWDDIGFTPERKSERTNVVLYHMRGLLEEMVSEEDGLRTKLENNVEKFTIEVLQLTQELNLPKHETKPGLTMIQQEKELRTKVDEYKQEKHERIKRLKKLKETDQHLCDVLCTTPYYIPTGAVPSKEQLQELEQHIAGLSAEKEKRQSTFKKTKGSIVKLLEELDQAANTSFERDILYEEEDSFLLSTENMKALRVLHEELETKSKENFALATKLREKLEQLWNRLNVEEAERVAFNTKCTGFRPSTINVLKQEISRCEQLKLQNIQQVIQATRQELEKWWKKCAYSQEQKQTFLPYYDVDFTEELLEKHEKEVQHLKEYYEQHQELFEAIEKREKLWLEFLEFEKKAADPNRLFNRKCNLLKEEKARKKLMKELPKVEADVAEHIASWEAGTGKVFLVEGKNYKEYIKSCWDNWKVQKENEKVQRQQNKAKVMQEEMFYGSKPTTPSSKRKFMATPSKTPTKMRKLNDTQKTPTNSLQKSVRTPRGNHTSVFMSPVCMAPRSASKTPRSLRSTTQKQERKALSEKSTNSNDTLFSLTTVSSGTGPTSSELHSIGPYHEFANGLNMNARPNCRSSVVPGHNKVLNV